MMDNKKDKVVKKNIPFKDQQVWIYTGPDVERKLATVVDPKMIDSRILHEITIPPDALFTARFNKPDASEERRLREWPDDSQWSANEFVSVMNDEDWQWYYTEPRKKVKVVHLEDIIQKEVDKQLNENEHLERINVQNEMIKQQREEITELKKDLEREHDTMALLRKCMQYEVDDAEQEITELNKEITEQNKEKKSLIECIVKMKWIMEQVDRVNGFTDTGKEIAETMQYIDFPHIPEDEKEEYVASSQTNGVVAATLQEDREHYGEDFHEITETETETETQTQTETETQRTPEEDQTTDIGTPPVRRNLNEQFNTIDVRTVGMYNIVDRYEDTSIIPDGPPLPWYEERFPTPNEIDAARVIQRRYRYSVNNNGVL